MLSRSDINEEEDWDSADRSGVEPATRGFLWNHLVKLSELRQAEEGGGGLGGDSLLAQMHIISAWTDCCSDKNWGCYCNIKH